MRPPVRWAILLIEHQLGFVRRLADRLYALDAGTVIAHGEPATVLADRAVVESYLGVTVTGVMLEVDGAAGRPTGRCRRCAASRCTSAPARSSA